MLGFGDGVVETLSAELLLDGVGLRLAGIEAVVASVSAAEVVFVVLIVFKVRSIIGRPGVVALCIVGGRVISRGIVRRGVVGRGDLLVVIGGRICLRVVLLRGLGHENEWSQHVSHRSSCR